MEICLYFCLQKRIKQDNMERQHGLNNQQQSLFWGHPNMNGSPVHTKGVPDPTYKIQKKSNIWEKTTLQYQKIKMI